METPHSRDVELDILQATRRSLHGVAELVLAGPQFERSRHIELRVTTGGFGTTHEPDLRVEGCDLVAGGQKIAMDGRSLTDLAAAVGLTARALDDVYSEGPGLSESDVVTLDPEATQVLCRALSTGDAALTLLAPDRPRVLWPEHFDVAIELDEVNYGVSPGDGFCGEPYAYVGPWSFDRPADDFWNAPFGAARTMRELGDVPPVLSFFADGRRRSTL
ncbi:MAG: hypothetical protein ABJA81_01780 [Nocardioidaceae bacterium]